MRVERPWVIDQLEGAVEYPVTVVGDEWLPGASAANYGSVAKVSGKLAEHVRSGIGNDLDGEGKLAERGHQLRLGSDDDESIGGKSDRLLAEEGAAAALYERPVGRDLVRAVDSDGHRKFQERRQRDVQLSAEALRFARGRHRGNTLAARDPLAHALDGPVRRGAGTEADALAVAHVAINRGVAGGALGRIVVLEHRLKLAFEAFNPLPSKPGVVRGASQRDFVIFDLDGTLVQSEEIWRDVRRDFAIENGGHWREGAQEAMIGMRTVDWARYMHDELGVALPPAAIAQHVVGGVIERLRPVPVLPGADAALERIGAAFRLALATSAALAVAEAVLDRTRWRRHFAVVVSADEVARGKPAPDVYELALTQLRADPSLAAAVEDSSNGIRSAHAAKLAVVAIPNRELPPDAAVLALASRVLSSLEQLEAETIRALPVV
jgi:beta-phosphoglucomutase-like phosphatase (HAD superfamily)